MRINDSGVRRVIAERTDAMSGEKGRSERGGRAAEGQAYEVTLSELGQQMSLARRALNEVSLSREERVAALKQSVQDGSYRVSAQELAQKLSELLAQGRTTGDAA